ncbi:mitochondrial potassium channel-like [Periplaneta americana]|uniref:mitochondrial potassium channel-like n=1 Tax=Periplaneta americana TaxID=6978 RepID=UPI0037E7BDED
MTARMCSVMPFIRSSKFLMAKPILRHKCRLMSNLSEISTVNRPESIVKRKFSELMQWYEEVTGMDEVRIAQNRVLEAEQKFITSQENRREANKLVSTIQNKLKDLYAELDNTTRGEERYVHLITQEHTILKEERRAVEEFNRYEREEREYFVALSSAVKESHEKERAQAERTKYWSIIGSIIGTVIGIVGSSVNNHVKMNELKRLVKESLTKSGDQNSSSYVPEVLSRHEKELSVIINEMKSMSSPPNDNDDVIGRLNELVHTLDGKMNSEKVTTSPELAEEILKSLKRQEISLDNHFREIKSVVTPQNIQISDDQVVMLPYSMEQKLLQQQKQTQLILVCCSVASVVVPLLFKYLGLL